MKHIKGLDTLRAFAVFFVFIQHGGVWFDNTGPIGRFITMIAIPDGAFGVHLFFVLSGFLITSILLKERMASDSSRLFVIKNFFVRRSLRIFPIYYLLIFVLLWLNYPEMKEHLGYFLTYTSNILCYRTNSFNTFSHTWTLSVEEQFYLIWPWLILFIKEKHLKYVFAAAIITGLVSNWYVLTVAGRINGFLVFNCFDAFGMGGLYAYSRLDDVRSKKFEKTIIISGCISLIIYLYFKIAAFAHFQHMYGYYFSKTIDSILSVWLIILVVKNKSERIRKYFLENRLLNYLGKISYGFYLYHYVYLIWIVWRVDTFMEISTRNAPLLRILVTNRAGNYWIHFTIIFLISSLSYFLIEKPILSLKRFFTYE